MPMFDDPKKELKVENVSSVKSDKYYRMQQYYSDIPVYGCTVVVGADENGNVITLTSNTAKIEKDLNITPSVSAEKVNDEIVKYFKENSQNDKVPAELVENLTDENLVVFDNSNDDKLAYLINIGFNEFVVDAHNAKIITVVKIVNEDKTVV